ncbi:MAG: hypothetical protein ACAI35_24770, partial [Candidatus Methylacidiphilales bacterium]
MRTYARGKEKWTSLRTKLLSIAKNRMKEHVDASERHKADGPQTEVADGKFTFGDAMAAYRKK